jgi:hypothetical protein
MCSSTLFADEPAKTEIHRHYHGGSHFGHHGWGWGNGRGVGTAESSARHGHANQMRSFGQMQRNLAHARYMNAKASIEWQKAKKARIEQYYQKKILRIDAILIAREQKADVSARKKKANQAYFARMKAKKAKKAEK